MRMRHTSRTDPDMELDRKAVSFRLAGHFRMRIKDVVRTGMVPDIRNESDLMQDALWLWFYEYDRGNGAATRTTEAGDSFRGTPSSTQEEVASVEVGEAVSPG